MLDYKFKRFIFNIVAKRIRVAGRHRAKGTISSLRTSRQRQAGFRARRALRKHNRKADRKYRYGSAMSESGSKTVPENRRAKGSGYS